MHNLPLVNFRLTLKGRNIRHIATRSEQNEKVGEELSEATTRGYTPFRIESRGHKDESQNERKENFFSKKEIVREKES